MYCFRTRLILYMNELARKLQSEHTLCFSPFLFTSDDRIVLETVRSFLIYISVVTSFANRFIKLKTSYRHLRSIRCSDLIIVLETAQVAEER